MKAKLRKEEDEKKKSTSEPSAVVPNLPTESQNQVKLRKLFSPEYLVSLKKHFNIFFRLLYRNFPGLMLSFILKT
jgi:hypothetical protein